MGAILFRLDMGAFLSEWAGASFFAEVLRVLLPLPYLLGGLLAAVFWLILRAAGKSHKEG